MNFSPNYVVRGLQITCFIIIKYLVSFCNAGFSIYSDNFISMRHNYLFVTVSMLLVITGGLGHIVLTEGGSYINRCWRKPADGKLTRLSLHSRVAMSMTASIGDVIDVSLMEPPSCESEGEYLSLGVPQLLMQLGRQ